MNDKLIGYLAVIGAIVFFGSLGLALKARRVIEANVDPMVFQLYYSFSIFLSSWLVLTYVPFAFTYWGIVGAALWVPSSVLAIWAIRFLGLSISQGVWSGVTIIVSFIWGSAYFGDEVKSIPLAIVSLLILMTGIAGLSISNYGFIANIWPGPQIFGKKFHSVSINASPEEGDEHTHHAKDTSVNDHEPETGNGFPEDDQALLDGHRETEATQNQTPSWHHRLFGMMCAVGLGGLNGSMMVALRLAPKHIQGINYLISFGIGVICVTPILVGLYFICLRRIPEFKPRVALIPGLLAGLLWNAGNYCSIYATLYLGLTIGFPLTQVALLVAGLYGIFWFREMHSWSSIIFFFLSAGVIIGGSVMLSQFG